MQRRGTASLLADAARLIRRAFDEKARDIGVTRPQWQVLFVLGANEGVHQTGLADLLEVEPITLCRMLDRLQEAGLVERRRDPADRRAWRLHLTDKARGVAEQLTPLADGILERAMDGISAEEQAALQSALERIRHNLSRRPSEAADG